MALPEMRLFQAAIALAEELNYSRAAVRLNLSQPALSKQIDLLEATLGLKLFERSHHRVSVTDAGQRFVAQARESVHYAERALYEASSALHGVEETLNIGRSCHTDPFLISVLTSIRLPLFPRLNVKLHSNSSPHLASAVRHGELDAAIVTSIPDDPKLSLLALEDHPFYIAFSADDALADLPALRLKELRHRNWVLIGKHFHPHIHGNICREAERQAVFASDIHEVATAEEAAERIRNKNAFAFWNRTGAWLIASDDIAMRPLEEPQLRLTTKLAVRADNSSRLVKEFVKAVGRKLGGFKSPVQGNLLLTS